MKNWMLGVSLALIVGCGGSNEEAKAPEDTAKEDAKPTDEKAAVEAMAEAFAKACEGKAAGDECTATAKDRDKELSLPGKCVQPPEESGEKRVVCLPNELPQ